MKNILSSILNMVISLIFGFYIPKLFLEVYGPSFHGCITTANNLSNYVLLLTAGLTTAAVQAMYAPMAANDHYKISSVYNAIKDSYRSISFLILLGFLILAVVMPFVIGDEISSLIVVYIYLVLGIQYFIDNLFLRQFTAIVRADDKISVINNLNTTTYILQAVLQIVILKQHLSFIVYQSLPVVIVLMKYFFLHRYIQSHYDIDKTIPGNREALKKRWNALIHQIAGLILYNTDAVLLTIACTQKTVSVYAVYNMIFLHIFAFLSQVCSTSIVATFGRKMSKGSTQEMIGIVSQYDVIYRVIICSIFTTISVVLLPFISLYTNNVSEITYTNYTYGFLFLLANILNVTRIPALTIVDAAGHYKETQNQAIAEALINLTVSLALVFFIGISGILIGTICSFIYRTFEMIHYEYKNILHAKFLKPLLMYVVIICNVCVIYIAFNQLIHINISTWIEWVFLSAVVFLLAGVESIVINYIMDRQIFKLALSNLNHFIKIKR